LSNIVHKKIGSKLKFVYSDNDTLSVIFQDNHLLLGVVGEFNSNLKELEKIKEEELAAILSRLPNIPSESTPQGKNEEDNLFDRFIVNFLFN